MRIAMLTYSVKPRGGVVHALEVSEALARRGHDVELMALARPGRGRSSGATRAAAADRPPRAARRARSTSASRRCSRPTPRACGRCSPAAATTSCTPRTACRPTPRWRCATRASIDHVIRTVHHVDDFTSPSLIECQDRSIIAPDHVLCVSAAVGRAAARASSASAPGWSSQRRRRATASARRATPPSAPTRAAAPGVEDRLAVLTVGGVEPRKGSLTLLEGFARLRARAPLPRPGAADRRRHDAVRLPPRARRASTRACASSASTRHVRRLGRAGAGRDRAAVPRRRRVRLPVGQGGLRARGAGGAGRRRCRSWPPTSTSSAAS